MIFFRTSIGAVGIEGGREEGSVLSFERKNTSRGWEREEIRKTYHFLL